MNSIAGSPPLRMQPPLRFVHASDLHLDRTIEHLAEGPASWEGRFLNIARRAAERLFQKVIDEDVDFLVLSGNILNTNHASPGLFLFLLDQFERLRSAGIPVYWAGAEFDSPEDWPTAFPLPDNVRFFPSQSIQEYYHQKYDGSSGTPIAKIVGMSRNQQRRGIRSSEFPLDPGGMYTVAVANGQVEPESLAQRRINYWALGGELKRQTYHGNPRKKGPDGKPLALDPPDLPPGTKRDTKALPPLPYTVHYPGSTVARSPNDVGLFGATLVEVPWGEEPVLTFFSTSPIRWVNDQITLQAGDDGGKLTDAIRTRIKNYREAQKEDDLMISWFVDIPPGPLAASLRRGSLTNDLLAELRTLYGQETPLTWSVSLTLLLPDRLPKSYYEQQTILGDFLRSVKHFQDEPHEIIDLESYLPKQPDTDLYDDRRTGEILLAAKVEVGPDDANELTASPSPLRHEAAGQSISGVSDKKNVRLVRTAEQAETQRRILREAAMVGLELLGGEQTPLKLFSLARPASEDERGESDNVG